MPKLGLFGTVKHFFGFFNLTEFEKELIETLRKAVDSVTLNALDDQLTRFNRVQRILTDDPRLDSGMTMFYWARFGKSLIDRFPLRIPGLEEVKEATFFRCLVRDSTNNDIRVDYRAVRGVFVAMKYYSKTRKWYPEGAYSIVSTAPEIPQPAATP